MQVRCVVGPCILTLILLCLIGTQGPVRGQGKGPQGGKGGGDFNWDDPESMFQRYADKTSKDFVDITKLYSGRDWSLNDKVKAYAKEAGISNGKLTKDQFVAFWNKSVLKKDSATTTTPGPMTAASIEPPKDKALPGPAGPPGPVDTSKSDEERAKEWFRYLDLDKDLTLTGSEIPDELRENMSKWDKNKDDKIDWDEFLRYAKDRYHRERKEAADRKKAEDAKAKAEGTNTSSSTSAGTVEEKKPFVIRGDNLSQVKGLPDWFRKLDTDKDGQIGLDEWKAAGKELDEFRKYDRNGDGFITVEEAIWYEKNKDRLAGIVPLKSK